MEKRQTKECWFWCEAIRAHVVWEAVRSNHCFTFICLQSYLFESCPSSVHHHQCSTECIMQSLRDCILCVVKQGAWFSPGGQTDRHNHAQRQKKQQQQLEIQSPLSFSCALLSWRMCVGSSSQWASRELTHSAWVSCTVWLKNTSIEQIDQTLTKSYTGFSIQWDKCMLF